MFEIRPVSEKDVGILSAIAIRSYSDHYLHYWTDAGSCYIEKSFSVGNLLVELADPGNNFFLAMFENEPVGFLKTRPENSLPMFAGEKAFEVERVYLTKQATGKGIGRALMEFSIQKAEDLGKDLVWLKAMDKSSDAIAFYKKLGFRVCGTERLDFPVMKKDFRGMVVMKRRLADETDVSRKDAKAQSKSVCKFFNTTG